MNVTVCVATYGEQSWVDLANQRAIPSVPDDVPVVHVHGADLCAARNAALAEVTSEWVCFLDADDELEPGYFDAMAQATADLRAPRVRYLKNGILQMAVFPRVAGHDHECTAKCLTWGNWLVIGTLARTDLVREVGGFREFAWSEDWDLWVRCWETGATVVGVAGAVYRAHVRKNSRNRRLAVEERLEVHRLIARANGLPVPA